jgi:two-component system, cell cycle sensor histidine kinase and response regulator CckA
VPAGGDTPLRPPTFELLSRLAGGVAHDLNNLLTVIAGRCTLALDRGGPELSVRRDLEVIRDTAQRAVDLAEQLRAFGRRQRLQPRAVDLNELLRDMAGALRRLLGDRIDLVIETAAEPGGVEVDPELCGQALEYLVSVAVDGMPEGGRLTVATAGPVARTLEGRPRGRPWVRVEVSDTGPGLDVAVRDRIFEPFVLIAGRRRGPGLRLAAAQGIVEQCGGRVELKTQTTGGTTFAIYLPALEVSSSGETAARPPASTVARNVMIVDDEPDVRDFAVQVLRGAGYGVLEAANGAQALELIEHGDRPVHLVVTDMVMPEMSGQELARRLAATHRSVKVLFMSGYASDVHAPRSLADLEADFLSKPFSAEGLMRKVRGLLDR